MIRRLLVGLAELSVRHPRPVLLGAVLAAVLGAGHAAGHLALRTSNLDLIDPDLPRVRAFTDFAERFGTPNVLLVVLEGDRREALEEAVDRLGPRLRAGVGVRSVVDRLPFDADLLADLGLERYLLSEDGGLALVLVQPDDPHSSAETIAPFVESAREAIEAARLGDLSVTAGLTGMPAYALDDRDVIAGDIARLSGLSAVLVLAVVALSFGSFWRPLLAVASLALTLLAVLGVVALHPGHLTLLSAFFASILFGLGIDHAIHLLGQVEALVAEGLSEREAVPAATRRVAAGLVTGASTTALVFFSMQLSGFKGFAELGLIAGVTILATLLATVTVLPALLVLVNPRPRRERRLSQRRLGRWLLALQRPGLALLVAAGAVASIAVPGLPFDTDYLNLQPEGSETVRLERAVVARTDLSPHFAVFVTDSEAAALDLTDRLLLDPVVGEVSSIADVTDLMGSADDPDTLRYLEAFRSSDGRHAVYAYPADDVWSPAGQEAFVSAMQAIDPDVTGMPLLGRFMVDRSRRALRITATLGVLILIACAGMDFRDARLTVLAVAPTILAVLGMRALMRLAGVSFNPLDVMALPVVIGIAVDDGVHLVHAWLHERGDLARVLAGTGRSVVVTSLTTIAAFGALALTSHRGLASFAISLCLGVASALALSVLVLPHALVRLAPPPASRPPVPVADTAIDSAGAA